MASEFKNFFIYQSSFKAQWKVRLQKEKNGIFYSTCWKRALADITDFVQLTQKHSNNNNNTK